MFTDPFWTWSKIKTPGDKKKMLESRLMKRKGSCVDEFP